MFIKQIYFKIPSCIKCINFIKQVPEINLMPPGRCKIYGNPEDARKDSYKCSIIGKDYVECPKK